MSVAVPLLLGISAIAAGSRPFFQKEVLQKINVLEFMALQIILIIIIAIIVIWKFKTWDKVREFDRKTWFFFFGSIVVSLISLIIYFYLIKRERPALIVSIYMPLTLIFTVIIGWIFFKDKITWTEILGITIIIIGIVIMNFNGKFRATPGFDQGLGEPI